MKTRKLRLALALMLLPILALPQVTIFNNPGGTITLTSQTFPGDVRILPKTTVIVPPSVLILMKNNSKIYVERDGARLIIDGGHITSQTGIFANINNQPSISDKWGGIEVWGNPVLNHVSINLVKSGSYPVNFTQAQGVLIVKNNGRISFANKAIIAGKANGDPNFSGGIVYTENASFIHNDGDIIFQKYTKANCSQFVNSRFVHLQLTSWSPVAAYVGLINENRNIVFDNCEFEAEAGIPFNGPRPNGLLCGNSAITVRNSEFLFFNRAILVENSRFCGTNSFKNNYFQLASKAIGLSGVDFAVIQDNIMDGVHGPGTIDISYGLYLEGCTGYKIQNNTFRKFTAETDNRGIFVSNSGSFGNVIRNNAFINNTGGIQAQDNNMGLQIKCNTFNNNLNTDNTGFRDAIVIAQNYVPSALRGVPNQGAIINGDALGTYLAGNSFSWRCSGANLPTITTSDYTATSNVNNFEYRHHIVTDVGERVDPRCFSTSKINLKSTNIVTAIEDVRLNSCVPLFTDPQNGWATVTIKRNQISAMKQTPPPITQDGIDYLEKSIQSDIYTIVNLYAEQDQLTEAIANLQEEKDNFKRSILVPIHLMLGNYDLASLELNAIQPNADDIEMIHFKTYYNILLQALINNITLNQLTSAQVQQLVSISNGATATAAKAKLILESYYNYEYPELLYLLPNGGLGKTTTGIASTEKPKTLNLYPSPAQHTVTIQATEPLFSVEIIDITGKTALIHKFDNTDTKVMISIAELPTGVYIAKVNSTTGTTLQKFTIIH